MPFWFWIDCQFGLILGIHSRPLCIAAKQKYIILGRVCISHSTSGLVSRRGRAHNNTLCEQLNRRLMPAISLMILNCSLTNGAGSWVGPDRRVRCKNVWPCTCARYHSAAHILLFFKNKRERWSTFVCHTFTATCELQLANFSRLSFWGRYTRLIISLDVRGRH